MIEHCLRDTEERGEGSLKSGHDIRHKELQDHDSKTQTQCFEDSHTRAALRKGTSFDNEAWIILSGPVPSPDEWDKRCFPCMRRGRMNPLSMRSISITENIVLHYFYIGKYP